MISTLRIIWEYSSGQNSTASLKKARAKDISVSDFCSYLATKSIFERRWTKLSIEVFWFAFANIFLSYCMKQALKCSLKALDLRIMLYTELELVAWSIFASSYVWCLCQAAFISCFISVITFLTTVIMGLCLPMISFTARLNLWITQPTNVQFSLVATDLLSLQIANCNIKCSPKIATMLEIYF